MYKRVNLEVDGRLQAEGKVRTSSHCSDSGFVLYMVTLFLLSLVQQYILCRSLLNAIALKKNHIKYRKTSGKDFCKTRIFSPVKVKRSHTAAFFYVVNKHRRLVQVPSPVHDSIFLQVAPLHVQRFPLRRLLRGCPAILLHSPQTESAPVLEPVNE